METTWQGADRMHNDYTPLTGRMLDLSPRDAELYEVALRTRTATATTTAGSITVEVSGDGTVHRWALTDLARRADVDRVVETLIGLIAQARDDAHKAVHADFTEVARRRANPQDEWDDGSSQPGSILTSSKDW
ncbi:hypothetical protein [Nocardia otitidiscaviarum]|uniref:hypothetical protein n=1 Tax=Nocardia otitidiscaviarum TaxID=1823 RepID=UPI0018931B63|nr:hypothetical protein [Nocardia otitidiscaviarum]MBF6183525.1 hypothetical protein [Nocardia otitidiscaviarum]